MNDAEMRRIWNVVYEWTDGSTKFALLKGEAWFALAEMEKGRWHIRDVKIPKPLALAIEGLV